jgi:redox-sensitive bicupin YhaK (pirin superfamily)
MTTLHSASTRGHARHGWLDSYHTFSFASYHDPARTHFGLLRVLNDDTVAGGTGFGTHPHANMEIVTIPLEGDLRHRDSTGRHEIIRQGDVQIMSAGSGIEHSEVNANTDRPVKLLQIWVFPKEGNIAPRYEQKTFVPAGREGRFQAVVSPSDPAAVWINQDAVFSLGRFAAGQEAEYRVQFPGNGVYAFVISGELTLNGQLLGPRDGLGVQDVESLVVRAGSACEVLLIEVPMH